MSVAVTTASPAPSARQLRPAGKDRHLPLRTLQRISRRRGKKKGARRGRPVCFVHHLAPADRPRDAPCSPGSDFEDTRLGTQRATLNQSSRYRVTLGPTARPSALPNLSGFVGGLPRVQALSTSELQKDQRRLTKSERSTAPRVSRSGTPELAMASRLNCACG